MDARDVFGVTPPSPKRPKIEETPPPADSNVPDRLSDLPEGLLHHLLSLLPAHEAVRTCVLARRWRHLWMSAPGLLVIVPKEFQSTGRFEHFVNRLLLLRGAAPLESCQFSLCRLYYDSKFTLNAFFTAIAPHLGGWILTALERQVKVLRVYIGDFDLHLPPQPLSSLHLTTLDLDNVITKDSFLDFSGCPALLNLTMACCDARARRISSQSLKHLSMTNCALYWEERTRMSLPSLVSLELIHHLGRAPLLESMPALQTATLTFGNSCRDSCIRRRGRFDACGSPICEGCYHYYNHEPVDDHNDSLLLNGLSEASQLILEAAPDMYVFMRDLKWCPTFTKLKTLVLGEWCLAADLDALILFLRHSPILEKLTLHVPPLEEVRKNSMEVEKIYNPLEQLVASSLLQMVTIKCQEVDGMVLRLLKMLNASGVPFDRIIIQCENRRSCDGCKFTIGQ
nr:F-box/LRR-repeat protein At1g52650-like [Lolium perenne]